MSSVQLPKYLQIAQQLEADIQAGRWEKGKLPSVRGIADEHKVSVVTASRALQILRDKHLINTVDRSGCYLIPPTRSQGECWALCLRVTPGAWNQAVAYLTLAGFETVARQQGLILDTETLSIRDGMTERDLQRQVRAARDAGVAGLFVLPSRISEVSSRQDEHLLAACHSQGLSVVLIERNLRGQDRPLEHDLICCDDVGGAAQCTRHLIEQGRRRIAFVTGSPISSHNDRLAGYLYGLHQGSSLAGVQLQPLVLQQSAELPNKAAFQELAEQLVRHQVDGVVCYQDYAAIGLILELLTRAVRVPRDVAVTGFDDLPVSNSFAVGVTTYAYPSESIARQAFRVMRERLKFSAEPPVKVVVTGQLIVRESSVLPVQHT